LYYLRSFRRTLVVSDPGVVAAGCTARACQSLEAAGIAVASFSAFDHDPTSAMADAGAAVARAQGADSLVGLGGGSSMDCAKAIGFLLANGGRMPDYRGYGKATRALPPMIAVPTTAGTGSEAQSYALVSDDVTHEKMACGDPSASFRVAILDPELQLSLPRAVTATTGYDAISHSVETWVTTARTPASDLYAREAFRLLESHYERVLAVPRDLEARGAMLLGAHWAGAAIETSMLGATHACANPLTARYGTTHGVAIALLLPHVVRWNGGVAGARYAELLAAGGRQVAAADAASALATRLEALAVAGGLPRGLRAAGIPEADLDALAAEAARQWTGRYNPRPFDAVAAQELYRAAFA
jgi:alcohol dehydrogenase